MPPKVRANLPATGSMYAIPHGILTHRSQLAFGTPFPCCPLHGREFDMTRPTDKGYIRQRVNGPFVVYDTFKNGRPIVVQSLPGASWYDWACKGHNIRILNIMTDFAVVVPGNRVHYYWPEEYEEHYPAALMLLRSVHNGSDPFEKHRIKAADKKRRLREKIERRARRRDSRGGDAGPHSSHKRRKRRRHRDTE